MITPGSHPSSSIGRRLLVVACAVVVSGCAAASAPVASPSASGAPAAAKVVVLKGSPTIRVRLDRDYSVLEFGDDPAAGPPNPDLRIWMFVPKDEQSSALFGIGPGGHRKTEQVIAKMYEGAKVTRIPGTVAGTSVEWWHYQDSKHLYSTCYAALSDRMGVAHPIYVDLVANSEVRLASLERAFSAIEVE